MVLHGQPSQHHLRRLIAYRSVKDYPLIITVGLATDEIFSRLDAQRRTGCLAAAILSLLILIVTGFSVRGHVLRDAAKKRLERLTCFSTPRWPTCRMVYACFGADKRLVLANDLYSTMYGLDPQAIVPGTTLPQILEARIAAGCAPEDSQKYVTDRMAEAFRPHAGYMVNQLKDGRTLAVSRRPMPDGGLGRRSPGHHGAIAR